MVSSEDRDNFIRNLVTILAEMRGGLAVYDKGRLTSYSATDRPDLGTVTAPEPRLLVVQPWDKSQMHAIEKAIQASPLDITPSNDGDSEQRAARRAAKSPHPWDRLAIRGNRSG